MNVLSSTVAACEQLVVVLAIDEVDLVVHLFLFKIRVTDLPITANTIVTGLSIPTTNLGMPSMGTR